MELTSRSSTPDAPPADLWSSILDSVSSSRSIPSKQILLLGQPTSGKTVLAEALLQKPASSEPDKDDLRTDFALGYQYANVRDEADEDTLARLSVYTVPSPSSGYTALLPHFLPPRTALAHTLVMVVLDWTRPWTFVEELEAWLVWIEHWAKGDGSRELEIVREESRERLQSHLQHYNEPTTDPIPATSSTSGTLLPLGPGTFTHNSSGVPIIVVCTKADLIDEGNDLVAGVSGMGGMVKGKGGEWEERTDGVMQVLRTICLKYGAGLFYTTQLPSTLQVLRQYALHLLFTPPVVAPMSSSSEAPAPIRNPFPFLHKSNTLDRDRILVPAGWDSWNKISVMRDSFEAKSWGDAWERDLDADQGEIPENGARNLFSTLVSDEGTKAPPLPPFNSPTPEQAFLAKNYDENAKKPDRDPRGAFKNPTDIAGGSAGIVGPLGSSSFNLPNVERALTEMEVGMNNMPAPSSRSTRTATSARPAALGTTLSVTSPVERTNSGASNRSATSPAPTTPVSPNSAAGGQSQHEVLQNFFQSLLSSKDRSGGSGSPAPTRTKVNGSSNSAEEGAGSS